MMTKDEMLGFLKREIVPALGCTLKTSTGAFAAIMSALYAVNGTVVYPSDGVCAYRPEDCIKNMARIGNNGMAEADKETLNIMVEKNME